MANQPEIANGKRDRETANERQRVPEGVRREEGARGSGEWAAGLAGTSGMARQSPEGPHKKAATAFAGSFKVMPPLARCRDIQMVGLSPLGVHGQAQLESSPVPSPALSPHTMEKIHRGDGQLK